MMNRARGIALIDLLVLVALISILAAIFIPQFAAYAVRTQNAAAISDLRGAVAAEESLFADYGVYGHTDVMTVYPGPGGVGAGVDIFGPVSPGSMTSSGGVLTSNSLSGFPPTVFIGITVSSGVTLRGDTASSGGGWGYGVSYLLAAKHMAGDTAFAAEAEIKKTIYACRNTGLMWVGIPGLSMAILPSATSGPDLNAVSCGGAWIPVWTPLP